MHGESIEQLKFHPPLDSLEPFKGITVHITYKGHAPLQARPGDN